MVHAVWSIASIAAYLALASLWGIQLLRRLDLPGQTPFTRFPAGLVIGISMQLVLVNLLSYVVAPPSSFAVALPLQWVSIALLRQRGRRVHQRTPEPALLLFLAIAVIVSLGFGLRAFSEFQLDNFRQHWLNVATISEGNFPVRHAFQPLESIRYHYGMYLISAELLWVSGAPIFWAPQIAKTVHVTAFLLLVFGIVYERRRDVPLAFVAIWTFAFYVGLPDLLGGLLAAAPTGGGFGASLERARQSGFFYFPSSSLFVASVASGWAIALVALDLVRRRSLQADPASAALLAVLIAALALAATPEFAVIVSGLGLFLAVSELGLPGGPPPRVRRMLGLALAAGVALACVQGGVLTDLLFRRAQDVPGEYALRWPPGIPGPTGDVVLTAGSWGWLRELVLASDGLALLVPIAFGLALRRPTPGRGAILATVASGFTLSHLLSYPADEFNTNRFLALALHLNLLLVFVSVADLRTPGVRRGPSARAAAAAALVVVALGSVPGLVYHARRAGHAVGLGRGDGSPSYLAWWDDAALLSAAAWIATVTPRGAWIGTNEPALVVALTGRFAPTGAVRTHGHPRPGALPDDYSRWSRAALEGSGVEYVCVFRSPFFQAVDLDLDALRTELAGPGSNRRMLREIVGARLGSTEEALAALNWIIRWQHRFGARVDAEEISGSARLQRRLAEATASPAGWMFRNRALLQEILPAGTAASRRFSDSIDDAHLERYAWVRELRERGPLEWMSPPGAAGRVRCLDLGTVDDRPTD